MCMLSILYKGVLSPHRAKGQSRWYQIERRWEVKGAFDNEELLTHASFNISLPTWYIRLQPVSSGICSCPHCWHNGCGHVKGSTGHFVCNRSHNVSVSYSFVILLRSIWVFSPWTKRGQFLIFPDGSSIQPHSTWQLRKFSSFANMFWSWALAPSSVEYIVISHISCNEAKECIYYLSGSDIWCTSLQSKIDLIQQPGLYCQRDTLFLHFPPFVS